MTARPILTISCLLAALYLLKAEASEWEKLPPLPEANGGFMAFRYHNSLAIAGGTNWAGGTKNWLQGLHFLDTQNLTWTSGAKLEAPIAYGIQLAGGFVGGSNGQKPVKALFSYDGEKSFQFLLEELPDSLVLSAGGQLKSGVLMVAGGTSDAANPASLTKRAVAITGTQKVERLPDYPGKPFGIAASATVGEQLFIFGGAHWDAAKQVVVNTSDAYAFAMETKSWRKLPSFPYAVRGLTAVALSDDLIYLAGGFKNDTSGFTDEAFLYDLQKNEYRPAKPLPYKAMVGLVVCDGQVYCLGGEDKQKSRTDACFRIPVADLTK
jgi:N-acetylneuraminic acid mutarotase